MNRRRTLRTLLNGQQSWIARWTAITAQVAWVLANALDVMSLLFGIQTGQQFILSIRRPAEQWVIYAGLRLLGTLAVALFAALAHQKWLAVRRVVWGTLTIGAVLIAFVAWWRIAG